MPYSAFISVVIPVEASDGLTLVDDAVAKIGLELSEAFSDYEIILIDNGSGYRLSDLTPDPEIRRNCFVVKLTRSLPWDAAVVAGLQRSNGDYVIAFDARLADSSRLVTELYETAKAGHDVTYLRHPSEAARGSISKRVFLRLMATMGETPLDPMATRYFMVSRRALNWVLRNHSRSKHLNETLMMSGYRTAAVRLAQEHAPRRRSRTTEHRLAWGALTRHTDLPLTIGKLAVTLMSAGAMAAIANALLVRFFQVNIFGMPEEVVPGWAFIVILLSIGLVVTNITIYAVLRVLYVVLDEIRHEPYYLIEWYGRL